MISYSKIHFKAVTFLSLQISFTLLLAGPVRGGSSYFHIRKGFCVSDSVKFIRGELDLQNKVANRQDELVPFLKRFTCVPLFVAG